ncbi:retinitis pigmentosa 1-like 1 protein [Mus musculus]|uniref:Retinitis pigmentosa 1-like 1 protein n=2 Tax=Mus musculus TaxID=10090 RepID=RP1L1_MOUSE|nr:retinitis pigmentosa 1-like 1 protein [Mus musculus]Q8CGM2.1 RecName: Full=Retinitis pigmentosa 1-like 1 protein; AltName: Full=Retinitis pigmentosa 1-like protein 1 [Mus musculus]AAI29888.1 Retinitis pigmentosa 1 homolog (human)-like 1 [Mus musculus]AAN86958.1 retinitis pigmentosa 1-like 1 protein [Mus musculus]EDL36055.1 mCG56960 [Mus musculus]CAD36958.1 retinitis pigmentosa 1-like protein 1 [Mus musculus]|eukprot:NP_666358.2 retinitis pigmentosa 1-like 1 protein [Mus musculus]
MNSTPGDTRDAPAPSHPAPSHRQCLLPSVAHTPSVTEVTPAKKITFLKRGDPQFAGVRLAVHQRTFKTFSSLMDELSQRMPLSFGVRSVTTPRGLHGLSALEQLQDGGCYLCSDRKPPKTSREPGRLQRKSPSAGQAQVFQGGHEAPETSYSWKGPVAPRRLTLVKNGDPRRQQTVVLSHKNTRSLAAFLGKASELLRFPVKQVYTTRGKKVDSLQTLLDGPSVLVCAGNEAFRCLEMENDRGNRTRKLSSVTARSERGCWGPNAKQSVIHSRGRSGGKLRQVSLTSERSGLSDHPASGHRAWAGPALDRCPQDMPVPPGSLVAADDVEKKVCMNEDGSLSVEMKVRFQLLGEDTLRWSQRVGQASVFTAASGKGQDPREADRFCCRQEGYPWGILKPGAQGLGSYDGGCQEAFDVGQKSQPSYDIWRNPLATPEGTGPTPRRRWGLAKLSGCKSHWRQEANHRKGHDKDNLSRVSTPRHPRSVQPGSCCPWTPDGDTGSDTLHPVSSASSHNETDLESGEGLCLEDTGPHGSRPETQSTERALSDTSVSAKSREESSEGGGQLHRSSSQARVMASREQVTKGDNPCISTQSHLPLNHMGLQTEKYRQGTRGWEVSGEPELRLALVPGHSGSQDTQRDALPAPACAPAQWRQRKQKRPASVECLPSVSVPYQVAQKGHARQDHYYRDTQSSLDTALQMPMPQEREQACPGSPAPQSPSNSPSAGNQASEDLRSPFSSSLDLQEPQATSKATTIAVSGSDCVCHSTRSVEPAGDTKCQAHSSTPTPAHRGELGCLWDKAGTTPEPFSFSVLLDRCPEADDPRTYHDCCCLQAVPSSPLAAPSGQTQTSISEACLGGSSFCPTPPKEQTCFGRESASNGSTSSGHSRADGFAGPRRTLLVKSPGVRGSLEEREADGGVTPSALPYASPDAVVREWLGNIPEKPVLMTYEMADENTEVPSDGPEGPKEDSLKVLGEPSQAKQQPPEGATNEHPEPAGVLSGPGSVCCRLGGDLHPDATSGERLKAPAEAGIGEGARVDHGVSLCALPTKVAASTQIMKALLGSKPGRPSSLPEVSSTVAQRLSSSAGAFIACLARLHFFDESLGPLDGKVRLEESPKYQEMLRLFQTLWPGSELWQGQLDFSLRKLTSHQALLGTEDFTPTSSSGVDVSSGSGGSGESSVPCVMDNTLAPEKRDLPLKIPSQRPDSRNQGYPELVGHSTVSSVSQVRACATGGEETGKGGRKQTWGNAPEQSVHSTMLEGDALSEETEGRVRERLQENSVHGKGLPEEGVRVCSQEMLAAGSQDGAGSPEDTRVPTDEAGADAASGGLWPLDGREEPTESPQHFSESNSRVREHQSAHKLELGLEEVSRLDARGCKQACIKASSGTMAHKGSLDPDPIWVSKLLKKIEKAFMAHLADATAELRARWDLHDNHLLDQMVTELEQDVGRRLQASTVMEVRKIQSRAGRMVPEPPREALRGQASLQTEQRRRRLQGLRNFSAVPGQGPLSLTLEDGPTLKTALGTKSGAEPAEDEFCPCEICLKKKRTPRFPKDAATVSGAPVRKAFDLQQILQSKKGGSSNREAMEVAPQRTGRMLSQEDLGTVQGADEKQGLGVAEGEEGEGKQRLRAEEDPEILKTEGSGCCAPEEDEATEEDGEICIGTAQESQQLEGTEMGKEGTLPQSFRDGGTLEAPARQGTHSVEIQEASRERQQEVEGRHQDVKEDSPWVSSGESQGRVGSENTSLDQEGRLLNHHQRPGPQSHHTACSSRALSLDNSSQVSQKGSDGDLTSGDLKCTKAKNSRVLHAEKKVPVMYPERSSSEQEVPSSPRLPKQGKGEDEGSAGSLACTQVGGKVDGFGQDDLDF